MKTGLEAQGNDMNDLLIRALERLLDFAEDGRKYQREDGSFDWATALQDWRHVRSEARTVLLAAMEEI
jgi:hypothetical protein